MGFDIVQDGLIKGQGQCPAPRNGTTPMDIEKVLTLYDREQRIEIEYPRMEKEVLPQIVRFL